MVENWVTQADNPQAGTQDGQLPGLSIQAAATVLGVSVNTVRRQVKSGSLRSEKVTTPAGYAYRVHLPLGTQQVVTQGSYPPGTHTDEGILRQVSNDAEPLLEALRLVDKLNQQVLELSGRCGYYQAENEQLRTTLKALQAPKEEPPVQESPDMAAPADAPLRAPWWRRWFLP
jgi:predicted DNA-binding protein (UPF0251 family)